MVTVPLFGFGMRPFGPRTRPRRPTTPIMFGVATTTSKSNQFSFWIFADELFSADIIGACLFGSLRLLALGEHENADRLAGAVRQHDRAADLLVCVTRSRRPDAREIFDGLVELRLRGLADEIHSLVRIVQLDAFDELRALRYFLPCFIVLFLLVVQTA